MIDLEIRPLEGYDVERIAAAFRDLGWNKPGSQYERYLREQRAGRRDVLVAFRNGVFTGYLTINWHPSYPPCRENGLPEIQDLNVLPRFRREGIGNRLMDEAERTVARHSSVVGIGVGVSPDYGAAQRLYVRRGYVPDGRGLVHDGRPVRRGDLVPVGDGLILYFTRSLISQRQRDYRGSDGPDVPPQPDREG